MTEHKTDMNITKYKKLIMTEHKTDIETWTLLKLKNTKKLNGTSTAEHKTGMNITEIDKYKKLNMIEHKTEYNYPVVNQTTNIYKPNKGVTKLETPHEKRLTKIFNQQLNSMHILHL